MSFRTVASYAYDEFIEKKSRFIGHIAPADTEAEASAFLDRIRSEHPSAKHNCYAWIVGENDRYQRSSDAGEPAGTAGRPILELIKHKDLHNTVIVVTRYFGGVLLGTGNLTRAYGKAAAMAVEAAGLIERIPVSKIGVLFDYSFLGKADSLIQQMNIIVSNKLYERNVCFICLVAPDQGENVSQRFADITGGSAQIQILEEGLFFERTIEDIE